MQWTFAPLHLPANWGVHTGLRMHRQDEFVTERSCVPCELNDFKESVT
jgi:hypothetical protein